MPIENSKDVHMVYKAICAMFKSGGYLERYRSGQSLDSPEDKLAESLKITEMYNCKSSICALIKSRTKPT